MKAQDIVFTRKEFRQSEQKPVKDMVLIVFRPARILPNRLLAVAGILSVFISEDENSSKNPFFVSELEIYFTC